MTIDHNQTNVTDAYMQLFIMAEQVANLLGKMGNWQQPMPAGYNPLNDPDVLAFMAQAIRNEVQAESQQVKALDAMDREV